MRVTCISKFTKDLSAGLLKTYNKTDSEFAHLTMNKSYTVYAIELFKGYFYYAICDEAYVDHPRWYPSELFFINDGRLSKYWSISLDNDKEISGAIFSYPEWSNDSAYFSQLVEGEEPAVSTFSKYKLKIDTEFPVLEINEKASSVDNEWAMCPICIYAWKPLSKDGMIICPNCKTVMHNPFYKDPE